jgi:hypothetical protein
MRIQTNYVRRFHLHIDPEARVLDCFRVSLIGKFYFLVHQAGRQNITLAMLWQETLGQVKFMQDQYHRNQDWKRFGIHRPMDLQPFAIVVACEDARERVHHQIDMDILIGEVGVRHEERVRHLVDAWDGLEWLAMN